MSEEFLALQKQSTQSLTPLPANTRVLGCKWTNRTKTHPDGKLDHYKARLVAQGYTQILGISYKNTFNPVTKMPTIHVFIIFSFYNKWPLLQFDVANAFHHGELHDDV